MRSFYFFSLAWIIVSCGGSISDEQRKQMLEARKEQAIQKVSDAQITDQTFKLGREIISDLTEKTTSNQLDSIAANKEVKIRWLIPGSAQAREIEQQLIDAYLTSLIMGQELNDNVQRIGTDSLLYTKPEVVTRSDGSVEVRGTWNIWISKKKLILGMSR